MASRQPRPRLSIRGMMLAVVWVALGCGVVRPLYLVLDAEVNGPYSRSYKQHLQQVADAAHLIGRPEADIIPILGEPSRIGQVIIEEGEAQVTFYNPSSLSDRSSFGVACQRGIVVRCISEWGE